MARATKAESFTAILAEAPEGERAVLEEILEDSWIALGLDYYPAGLDYFMLHTATQVGWSVTECWLGRLLEIIPDEKFWIEATKRLRRYPDLGALIDGLTLFRLRRLRADAGAQPAMGRLAAPRSRALTMLGRTAAEVAA